MDNKSEEDDDCPAIVPIITPAPIQSIWAKKPNLNLHAELPKASPTIVHAPQPHPAKPTSEPVSATATNAPSSNASSTAASSSTGQDALVQKQEALVREGVVASSQAGQTERLVLDTVTFIKHVKLENVDVKYYTVSEVLQEVRDSKARFYLETFPHEIIEKRPHPAAIAAVTKFSQKTGDYPSLSKVDILVLALTYTLEMECHGNVDHLRTDPSDLHDTLEKLDFFKPLVSNNEETGEVEVIGIGEWEGEGEEDDNEGWITADNIQEYTQSLTGMVQKDDSNPHYQVACLTADFAMQNVLLQMNMNVMSVDGLAIKTVKRWVNRCYACLKLVKDQRQLYCGNCGSTSLHKVSYSVSKDGDICINLPTRKRNLRGTIYPIPLPKGGKHSHDLILGPSNLPARAKSRTPDLNDPDGEFFKPMKKPLKAPPVIGYGKKNPNEARRAIGKKNKTNSRFDK